MENQEVLSLGSKSTAVVKPKLQLVLLGFNPYSGNQDYSNALASGTTTLNLFDQAMEEAVKIFQGQFGPKVSGTIDTITAQHLAFEVVKLKSFAVVGTVYAQDGEPYTKSVQAVDKDIRSEEVLGKTKPNKQGEYAILYNSENFGRAEKDSADLLLRVYDAHANELAKSEIIFNAGPVEIVNFELEDRTSNQLSECERYHQTLNPLLENVNVQDLTHEDIVFLNGETGISRLHLKLLQLDAEYSQSLQITKCVIYGLMRQELPTDLERLCSVSPDKLREAFKKSVVKRIVPSDLNDQLELLIQAFQLKKQPQKEEVLNWAKLSHLTPTQIAEAHPNSFPQLTEKVLADLGEKIESHFMGSSDALRYHFSILDLTGLKAEDTIKDFLRDSLQQTGLSQSLRQLGFAKVGKWDRPSNLNDLLLPEVPLNRNPLFQIDLQQADTFRISELAGFEDNLAQQLIANNISLFTITADKIKALTDENVINQTQGKALLLNGNLYALANSELLLSNAIKNHNGNDAIRSLKDLAVLEIEDWQTILQNAQTEDDADALKKKARIKHRQIELLFPHAVFKSKSKKAETSELKELMNTFYTANEELAFLSLDYSLDSKDLERIHLDGFSEPEKEKIVRNLKTNQRLYTVAKNAQDTLILKKSYNSAHEIAFDSLEEVMEKTGFGEATARSTRSESESITSKTNIGFATMADALKDPLIHGMVRATPVEVQSYLRRLQGYEDFFGETDYCKCKHCKSIISPAAYFVDLMDFLNQNVLVKVFPEFPPSSILDPRKRRPDLWSGLVLNCENTHGLIPYLVIINEILENFIFIEDTDGPLSSDRHIIENHVYRLLSHEDTEPLLINSFYQPFNLFLVELETYLKHFPISRHSIAKTLLADVGDPHSILPQAALKLSEKEFELIRLNKAHVDPENIEFLSNLYNIVISTIGIVPDIDVQDLLRLMGISRVEFTTLINTKFVTLERRVVPDVEGRRAAGDLQITSEYLTENNLGILDRMHRFIRLWRQLPWSLTELDQVIHHLHHINEALASDHLFPSQVVQMLALQKTLRINIDELSTLINGYPAHFFDQRFNLSTFVKEVDDRWSAEGAFATAEVTFQHPNHKTPPLEIPVPPEDTILLHRLLAGLGVDDEQLYLLIDNLKTPLEAESEGPEEGRFQIDEAKLSLLYRHALFIKKFKLKVEEMFLLLQMEPSIAEDYLNALNDIQALVDLIQWQKESNYSVAELGLILEIASTPGFEEPATIAYDIWSQIQSDQSLLFADTLFSLAEGISEAQSRDIIRANSDTIVQADLHYYRINYDAMRIHETFNLNIPAPINENLSEEQRLKLAVALLNLITSQLSISVTGFDSAVLESVEGIDAAQSAQILNANTSIFSDTDSDGTYLLVPEVRADPTILSLTIDSSIWDGLIEIDQLKLYTVILDRITRYIQPGAPEFTDRLFIGIAGLDLVQSRRILTDNDAIFVAVPSELFNWLSPAFEPKTNIIVPTDIPLPAAKAQELLLARHVSQLIPNFLSAHLGFSTEKLLALAELGGYNFSDGIYTEILQGTEPMTELVTLIKNLQKLAVWFKDKSFQKEALAFIKANSSGDNPIFGVDIPSNFADPALSHLKETELYRNFLNVAGDEITDVNQILENDPELAGTPPRTVFADSVLPGLARLLNADSSLVNTLNAVIDFPSTNLAGDPRIYVLKALHKFKEVTALVQYLGIGATSLPLFISPEFDDLATAVRAVVTAIRTKYETEEEWQEKIGPFEDKLRERKRDALTDYLMNTFRSTLTTDGHWFQTKHDLYNYFLIDTELEGCARTSRVVAGISSCQLYIQRCLLNLEQSEDGTIHVLPSHIPREEWEGWRKNYRVWEANRKVFLYPENYIEPDLRDNKTELFKELESTLLQQEINAQNSEDAYAQYLQGFEEIATLKISGAYHHLGNVRTNNPDEPDTLHLFGVTSSDPPVYYYRTIENLYKAEWDKVKYSVVYNPWEKINLQIPVKKVSPIVYNGRLYIFWVEIMTRPMNEMIDGTNQFSGYKHNMTLKFSVLQLGGAWQAPQKLEPTDTAVEKLNLTIIDKLIEQTELLSIPIIVPGSEYLPFSIRPEWVELNREKIIYDIAKKVRDNPNLLAEEEYKYQLEERQEILFEVDGDTLVLPYDNLLIELSGTFISLFQPNLSSRDIDTLHFQPIDGHTLKGYKWDRVYPHPFDPFLGLYIDSVSEMLDVDLINRSFFPLPIRIEAYRRSSAGLNLSRGDLSWGRTEYDNLYFHAEKFLNMSLEDVPENPKIITPNSGNIMNVSLINGVLKNAILDVNSDLFLLYQTFSSRVSPYVLKRLGSTLYQKMTEKIYNQGIHGLLNLNTQNYDLKENSLPFNFLPEEGNIAQKIIDAGTPDFTGSLGTYMRESFFHIPFLIANHLNSQNKFADAQRWYHYIFDPTASLLEEEMTELEGVTDPLEKRKIMAKRVWQFIEFRNHGLASWRDQLNDPKAISTYEKDPFNPHAIARLRLGAYMKSITMKYIDNLLDWGDHLFAQDNMESINEATLLYVMASEILGERPAELGDCKKEEAEDLTFEALKEKLESGSCRDFLNGIETEVTAPYSGLIERDGPTVVEILDSEPLLDISVEEFFPSPESETPEGPEELIGETDEEEVSAVTTIVATIIPASFHTSFLKQACHFCIPPNPDLLTYWDRVGDRLFKIRNCMNFSGVRRQISLFAPEIDPRLLVRAKAAGLSLDEVLSSVQGDLPPYRFAFLLAKAKEYAGALQGFGAALLGALEKKSAEELALLRMKQQDEILKVYTTKLRDLEVAAAESSLDGLRKRKESIEFRKGYFHNLVEEGLSNLEVTQDALYYIGHGLKAVAIPFTLIAGAAALPPSILGFSFSTPSRSIERNCEILAYAFNATGELSMLASNMVGKHASYERREQGWEFSKQQAENELKEIEKQLIGAEIRRDISVKSRELHEKSIEQHKETYEFYRDKFTNLGLYTYLSTELQRMFRTSYQNAMTIARMAERAYRFERNDDTSILLEGSFWEASRAGLLSGEKLMDALRSMELRYMETNTRSMEVDQAFSLTQINPSALLDLKTKGKCTFTVPEFYFDLFYPGQYRRQVKSARLTIPCITGPYSNVSAVMTLKGSSIRKDPKLDTEDSSGLSLVPPSRSTTVATSTAQNDSGVFRLDFRDERYMPFEGAGAVESSWEIELPKNLRPFDYSTINDCILHISYTAEYDTELRDDIEEETGHFDSLLSTEGFTLRRLFSLRQEFSQAYHQILHNPISTEESDSISLELNEKHFPLFLQGKELEVVKGKLIIELDERGFGDVDWGTPPSFASFELDLKGIPTDVRLEPTWELDVEHKLLTSRENLSTIFASSNPATEPMRIIFSVKGATVTDLGAEMTPGDNSALDDHKIKDIYLALEYRVAPESS